MHILDVIKMDCLALIIICFLVIKWLIMKYYNKQKDLLKRSEALFTSGKHKGIGAECDEIESIFGKTV